MAVGARWCHYHFLSLRCERKPSLPWWVCGEDILKEGPALVEGGDSGSERRVLHV